MLDFPEIPQSDQPPLIVLTQHRIGGSGKSLAAQLLCEAAHRSGLNLSIFDNDEQRFFDAYGTVSRIKLPASESVVHDPIADIRVHAALDRRLHEAQDNECIIYDCAAASIDRHTFVVDELDIALRLQAMDRHCVVFVPVTVRPDIAREAIVAYEIWRDLLDPPNRVIPVLSHRDGDVRNVPAGHDLRKLLKIARDGVLVVPPTPMAVINEIRLSGLRLGEMADPRNILATAEIAHRIGQDPTIFQLMRRASAKLLTGTDAPMRRLGFTLGL